MFMGNITTGLFWAAHARRTRDPRMVASAFAGIIRSDRWFTLPGVAGIVIAGIGAAVHAKLPVLSTGWIFWSIVLFSISGVVYAAMIAPLQRSLFERARNGDTSAQAFAELDRLLVRWERCGLLALLTPAIALVLMVLKPPIPGL